MSDHLARHVGKVTLDRLDLAIAAANLARVKGKCTDAEAAALAAAIPEVQAELQPLPTARSFPPSRHAHADNIGLHGWAPVAGAAGEATTTETFWVLPEGTLACGQCAPRLFASDELFEGGCI